MPSLLRIDSSPRGAGSHSKFIADAVQKQLVVNTPDIEICQRDLSIQEIPSISQDTITGFFTPKENFTPLLEEATTLSDQLIKEIKEAETLVISAPIYNFGVPSSLKAWIDQIVRVGETFSFDESGFSGLVRGKKAILALSYGAQGYTGNGDLSSMNFFEPYLVALLNFIGIEDITVFRIEGTSVLDEESLATQKFALQAQVKNTLEVN
ncbi:FMN-dependent NADH-azoreductase [Bacterioplanes sanyensis]|uniref:FMN dependent NADH:quinone oxidoreductase n=1 Tax=Bacterioplanes sanyensis TaxID=1249553 RepID=A0A222FIW8_9GAMM|nr:NAD(P)H-dependent oxidoreductase [Bacterioplanes sanyensis]ASP38987.1 FMN-dependent NADH-azoreductase [Bacterioplanes sanyensis]